MANFKVGASRDLPLASDATSWDGDSARKEMVEAGADMAKRGHLVHDADVDLKTQAAYRLPFARLLNGKLTAVPAGLRNAASRLPQTDIPQSVKDSARKVLDAYFKRLNKMLFEDLKKAWCGA